ncbi:sigma-70 family RNA polymerase sigma factor [Citromicrobium bathyomarinum]|jgi:RNA polymerase sigma-70 factor (ECF subfamily)|uniref:Sigma-70 family RNA polymerase sigma factor n=1 Tax=Tsuneonella suprasediminis TaxID=2306996 RepID=A0A419R105_9SPHN|nr:MULTISPECIES: sigma-70 family RNA polymerase sigma factor [Erythrobacteraceae]MCP2017821.1 RNA polymerase sigma-70 factor (ECF subfamily) [Qipengyuania citrea]RJX67640.1 sigma-70 family RNA polymerase sigma factor [Tsuneonella suprasediminis]
MPLSYAAQSEDIVAEEQERSEPENRRETNREIIERVLVGDYVIFRRLALKRLRDRLAADDVLQSFCVKALERAHQLRDENAVHGWLRRLFETTLLDHYRASARLNAKTTPLEPGGPPLEEISGESLSVDESEVVEEVLATLRPAYTQIIRQMDLGRDEPSVIASRLHISPNNLAVRLHRARGAFRDALADTPIALQT